MKKNQNSVLFITARAVSNKYQLHKKFDNVEWEVMMLHIMKWLSKNWSAENCLCYISQHAYMGEGLYGVEAASQHHFGKSKTELDYKEISVLLAIFRNPVYFDPVKHPERSREMSDKIYDEITKLLD